jgi:hypothetical protein
MITLVNANSFRAPAHSSVHFDVLNEMKSNQTTADDTDFTDQRTEPLCLKLIWVIRVIRGFSRSLIRGSTLFPSFSISKPISVIRVIRGQII